jgi:hypothetical protein
MSIRTVQRWLKMWSESGDYRPKQNDQKGHSAQITDWEGFRQFVEANPGLTQWESFSVSVIQPLVKPLKKSTLPVNILL